MQNIQKWVSLSLLVVGITTWLLLRQMSEVALTLLPWRLQGEWIVPPQDWVGIVGGIVLFVTLRRSAKVTEYIAEVIGELSKVVWPMRKETVLSTGVVAVMVAIASLVMLAFDTLWGTVIAFLYR